MAQDNTGGTPTPLNQYGYPGAPTAAQAANPKPGSKAYNAKHPATSSAPKPAAKPASSSASSALSGSSLVRAIQAKLGVTVDGVVGPQTKAAIVAYQRAHGLTPDGIAGPLTLGKMGLSSGGSSSSAGSASSGTGARTANSGGGGTAAAHATASKSTADLANLAADLGWSQAVINSNPELKAAFTKASQQGWTTQRFVAEIRNTNWFKTHSDAWRKSTILQISDPATYKNNVNQATSSVQALAAQVGAVLSPAQLHSIGTQVVQFGWSQDQIKQTMLGYIKPPGTNGAYSGQAGQFQQRANDTLAQYGVSVSPQVMAQWVRGSITGAQSLEQVQAWAQQQAASKYPGLRERLQAGETMQQIVDPYRQSYAKILEVNPNTVTFDDPKIQQALQAKDQAGKPTTQTVWEFENQLRQDPRWTKTQQAQDQTMSVAHSVLKDFGLQN